MAEIKITADNTGDIKKALYWQAQAALEACGQQAVSHAKQNITAAGRVDTGAMRNSMNHQVVASEYACYVGTNQEYAIYNEYGTGIYAEGGNGRKTPWTYVDDKGEGHRTRGMKPIHFLKNAIQDHIDEYKNIIKNELSK